MSDEIKELADELEELFSSAVEDFKDDLKEAATEYLKENAKQFAKYTVLANKATGEVREKHRSTLRHLIAQAVGAATREVLVANKKAGELLGAVVGAIGKTLEKLTGSLLGKLGG